MEKVNMRSLNKKWRKITGARSTKGIKFDQKLVTVILYFGHEVPKTKSEKIKLALRILKNPSMQAGANSDYVYQKPKRAPVHTSSQIKSGPRKPKADKFYSSWEWKKLRLEAIKIHGQRCQCCGWRPGDTDHGRLVVDHIKPRSKHPALSLQIDNLQVLCNDCNMGKSNIYEDDFRELDSWLSSIGREE